MRRPHLALPYDFKLKDQEGRAQALLGPQEEPASIPWFHFSFDMLILQSLWNINHLRLINFSICICSCDLSYPGATFAVLIANFQGHMLCNCTGNNDCTGGGRQG